MKKYFLILSILVAGIMAVALAPAETANAAEYDFKCGTTEIKTSIDFSSYISRYCAADSNSITVLILMVIDFLAIGVGIAVVGGIAYGGVKYASSAGDTNKTKEAIGIVTNAVIGLVLFVFMYAILNFFVPGGVFNTSLSTSPTAPTVPSNNTPNIPAPGGGGREIAP